MLLSGYATNFNFNSGTVMGTFCMKDKNGKTSESRLSSVIDRFAKHLNIILWLSATHRHRY